MKRYVSGIAATAAAAAAAAALFGGAAQAGEGPQNHDGASGSAGTGTATCQWMSPVQMPESVMIQCLATSGAGGTGGAAGGGSSAQY